MMVVEFSVLERITERAFIGCRIDRSEKFIHCVTDVPAAAVSVLLAVGFFTTAAFVSKTLLVLLQTFILPGKSVS